jgi:hypothetical protein
MFLTLSGAFGLPSPLPGSGGIDRCKERSPHLFQKGPLVTTEPPEEDRGYHECNRTGDGGIPSFPGGDSTVLKSKREAKGFGGEPCYGTQVGKHLPL